MLQEGSQWGCAIQKWRNSVERAMNDEDGRMKPLLSVVARLDDNRLRTRVNKGFGFSIQGSSRRRYCECFTSMLFLCGGGEKVEGVNGAEMARFVDSTVADGFRWLKEYQVGVNELIAIPREVGSMQI